MDGTVKEVRVCWSRFNGCRISVQLKDLGLMSQSRVVVLMMCYRSVKCTDALS
jgi:hypothetical protein